MVFKTKEEKAKALLELPSEPEAGVDDLDAWNANYEVQLKEIEDATIEGETASDPPQKGEEDPPVEPDETLNFSLKRSELPAELKGYKTSDEIVKQYAHARDFANRAEEKLEQSDTLSTENKSLKEQMEAVQEELKKLKETPPLAPKQTAMEELEQSVQKLETMDDTDYLTGAQAKNLFKNISEQVKGARDGLKKFDDLEKQVKGTKDEFGEFKTTLETTAKETTEKEQNKALEKSLSALQDKNPELKLSKPVIGGDDCVQNDMFNFAKKVLGGLYSNFKPEWNHVSALINAYLKDDPTIKAYCEENAVTPESVGTSKDEIQKYVIIHNVHERSRGNKINPNGTVEELKNPYTGEKVAYANHIDAYKSLKEETGVAEKELQEMIAAAEKRAQVNMGSALQKRAGDAITLGSAGEGSPDDIGEQITENQAREILKDPDLEFIMQTEAMQGNRTVFNKVNKALKRLKQDPFEPDPGWPAEIKVAK